MNHYSVVALDPGDHPAKLKIVNDAGDVVAFSTRVAWLKLLDDAAWNEYHEHFWNLADTSRQRVIDQAVFTILFPA